MIVVLGYLYVFFNLIFIVVLGKKVLYFFRDG